MPQLGQGESRARFSHSCNRRRCPDSRPRGINTALTSWLLHKKTVNGGPEQSGGRRSEGAGKAERGGGESGARGRGKRSAGAGKAERGGGKSGARAAAHPCLLRREAVASPRLGDDQPGASV